MPYGWLLANGASVLRSQYNKLFALIGTKFGAADQAHFNLPNLHHRFIEGTTALSEVGSYVKAGLPNIKPNINARFDNTFGPAEATGEGAISIIGPGVTHVSVNSYGEYPNWALGFDASKSNPIYGRADTVQPNALRALVLIRSF